ncbi:MAG: hypothetical protein K2X66_11210 [Cyanobacteria bacterium]|nr:hypothetical protein [Cyanobacteriota bacterium]
MNFPLSRLLPTLTDRPAKPTQGDANIVRKKGITIIEAPSRNFDLPIEMPSREYRPSKPTPDPVELPAYGLNLLVGDDFLASTPAKKAPTERKHLLDLLF